MTEENVD